MMDAPRMAELANETGELLRGFGDRRREATLKLIEAAEIAIGVFDDENAEGGIGSHIIKGHGVPSSDKTAYVPVESLDAAHALQVLWELKKLDDEEDD